MSFVDPVTIADPVTGEHAEAALLNTWRDNHDFLHGQKAGVRCRTNTATATSSSAIPFELEDYDHGGCHTTGGSNTRITVPSGCGGWWAFGFCVRISAQSTFRIFLNGDTTNANALVTASCVTGTTSTTTSAMGIGQARLAVGDYIELYSSAGTVSTTFNAVFWAQFLKG